MSSQEQKEFIELTIKTIQSNYENQQSCRNAMIHLLNMADGHYKILTGKSIVERAKLLIVPFEAVGWAKA